MRKPLALALAMFLLTACGSGEPEAVSTPVPQVCPASFALSVTSRVMQADLATRRFLVKPKARIGAASTGPIGIASKLDAMAEEIAPGLLLLELPEAMTGNNLAQEIGEFEYIEPDSQVHAAVVSNDEDVAKQWAHSVVETANAWSVSRGSREVVVAVLDSGVDYTHADLAANIWRNTGETLNGIDDDGNGFVDDIRGWNFAENNNSPKDPVSTHGSHVAGTIGAVTGNEIGIAGHAAAVRIMPVKFLDSSGSGTKSNAIRGIDYAIKMGAHIINNSWGSSDRSEALSEAVDRAQAAGILFVAAAGNSSNNNDESNFYPSGYPQDNVIRVAASDKNDNLSSFSNYGSKTVDLAAPGSSIYSTLNENKYGSKSGTSMAAPLVSGVLATMIALRPDLTYRQLKGVLLETVDVRQGMRGRVATGGRINSYKALTMLSRVPGSYTPAPLPAGGCPPAE